MILYSCKVLRIVLCTNCALQINLPCLIQQTPTARPSYPRLAAQITTWFICSLLTQQWYGLRQWSEEASEVLQDCFNTTDWDVLCGPHGQNIDSLTDCITGYIHLCVETTVPTKRPLQTISRQGKGKKRDPEPGDRDWTNKLILFFNRCDTSLTPPVWALSSLPEASLACLLPPPHHSYHLQHHINPNLHHIWGFHPPPHLHHHLCGSPLSTNLLFLSSHQQWIRWECSLVRSEPWRPRVLMSSAPDSSRIEQTSSGRWFATSLI